MFFSQRSLFVLSASVTGLVFNGTIALSQEAPSVTAPVNAYPPEEVQTFVNTCASSAAGSGLADADIDRYCNCTIQEFQNRYTYDEFSALIVETAQQQSVPPEFIDVVNVCASQVTPPQ